MQRNLHHCRNPAWNNHSLESCPWMENPPEKIKLMLTNRQVVENFFIVRVLVFIINIFQMKMKIFIIQLENVSIY